MTPPPTSNSGLHKRVGRLEVQFAELKGVIVQTSLRSEGKLLGAITALERTSMSAMAVQDAKYAALRTRVVLFTTAAGTLATLAVAAMLKFGG